MKAQRIKLRMEPGNQDYYTAIVFKEWRDMIDHYAMRTGKPRLMNIEASTLSAHKSYIKRKGKKILSKCVGEILFYGKVGHGVVSHEVDHAATFYFARKKWEFSLHKRGSKKYDDMNERHAYIVGYMVEQFWKKYKKVPNKKALY